MLKNTDEIKLALVNYFTNKYNKDIAIYMMDSLIIRVEKKDDPLANSRRKSEHENRTPKGKIIDSPLGEKIGQAAKRLFGHYFLNGIFTDEDLDNLCDIHFSKKVLNSTYPIVRKVTDGNVDEIRMDINGYFRYYKDVYKINGRKFVLTSQWYSKQKHALDAYFRSMNHQTRVLGDIREFDFEGIKYNISLNADNMSKYPHLIDTTTGYIPKNQKDICREFLKSYGFDLPFDGDVFITHDSIRLVNKVLNDLPLTAKELSIKTN